MRNNPIIYGSDGKPINKGYGDAGASWQKKALKGFVAQSGSPQEDIDQNNGTLRQRARMLYMAAPSPLRLSEPTAPMWWDAA